MKSILVILCLLSLAVNSVADTRLVYGDRPIAITLPVDAEIRIVFPEAVSIDVPTQLSSVSATQASAKVAYFKASQAIDAARLIAQSVDGSRVYLIDLGASVEAEAQDYKIENPVLIENKPAPQAITQDLSNPFQIEFTRFAAQTLYGPLRLRPTHTSIKQVPVGNRHFSDLIRSQQGETFFYQTVGAWRGWGHYLTAVQVINASSLSVSLDPRLVRGDFDTIAFQHGWLGPKGSLEDRTTLYLISKNPLIETMGSLSYGQ